MLETVRAFGLERLAESGEEAAVRAAHADYVLEVARQTSRQLFSPEFNLVASATGGRARQCSSGV